MQCPKCGSKMIVRTARKGSFAGKQFYGCSGFPNCRETVNIDDVVEGENVEKVSKDEGKQDVRVAEQSIVEDNEELITASSFIMLKPRSKQMYLNNHTDMEKYSANYAYTNHNFVIQNNVGTLKKSNKYYSVICILKNIVQRGCPTIMSKYLQEKLGPIHKDERFGDPITLISTEVPIWTDVIKGDSKRNYYPALDFFESIIPEYIPEFKFIQQLILPEVPFTEITLDDNEYFENQQVDFYLPQAKLVIEIDGQQHKSDDINRMQDQQRDSYLMKFHIKTIRIDTQDIKKETNILIDKMNEIRNRLEEYSQNLEDYKESFDNQERLLKHSYSNKIIQSTAIIRFQILILSLLETGRLSLTRKQWKLSVASWENIKDFEELALEDLFIWIENLCKLQKLEFNKPKLIIKRYHPEDQKSFMQYSGKGYININFSLFKRWTDENKFNTESIYVRTDYFDQYNYFKVSTSKPISYSINSDGIDSDKPVLRFFLKNIFGFNKFNSGQLPSIINSLSGNDTIGLLPTGGGKSLIYQFVGLLQPTISFIVCPILSLMKDQRDNLDKNYISNTQFISSGQSSEEKTKVQMEYGQGKYQFVWITPERFQSIKFRNELEQINNEFVIGIAVIDEVHCLSEWGHDFRTSYLNLAKTIKKYCPNARILGLTATASENVLKDIRIEFDIDKSNIKTLPSFTRKELSFKIIKDNGINTDFKKENLKRIINELAVSKSIFNLEGERTKSGIIFTRNVNGKLGCYQVRNFLNKEFAEHNADVKWYSGSSPKVNRQSIMNNNALNRYKEKVQEDFKENKFPLLVATKAFGMGIDKSNVRYTIHYGIPGSLEALYQEAGRAGRDKKDAVCYILLSEENVGERYLEKLFDLKTSVKDIQSIQEEVKFDGRDVFGNIFFWLNQCRDPKDEFKDINHIYNSFAKPNKQVSIPCNAAGMTKSNLEKVIYKLGLIGVVEDWVIEKWDEHQGIIKVDFSDFNDKNIEDSLLKHIRKYDPKFDYRKKSIDSLRTSYNEIYNDKNLSFVEKMIKILLVWNYENIAYNRRESIKTVYEQCTKEQSEEEFKKYMESYFKFGDASFFFDFIAENPDQYEHWFSIFYKEKDKSLLGINELNELKGSLRRFIESYRFNAGLNYIDGMLRLLTNETENKEPIERLKSAFEAMKEYSVFDREEIFQNTILLSKDMDGSNKEVISEILNEFYDNKAYEIFDSLNDNYSLYYFMDDIVGKIKQGTGGLL